MADKTLFTSRDEIIDAYGLSKYLFKKFVKMGLPVLYLDNRYYAHRDNVDEFFRHITRVNSSRLPDNVLESDD